MANSHRATLIVNPSRVSFTLLTTPRTITDTACSSLSLPPDIYILSQFCLHTLSCWFLSKRREREGGELLSIQKRERETETEREQGEGEGEGREGQREREREGERE